MPEVFNTFDQLSLKLPLGLMRDGVVTTGPNPKLNYNIYTLPEHLSTAYPSINSAYFALILEHKRIRGGKPVIGVRQAFSTKKFKNSDSSYFNPTQYIKRKPGYFYRWTQKGGIVNISKLIGTTNINQIKFQGYEVLKECQRFIFMYCQG